MSEPAITMTQLRKRYGTTDAVADLSLRIDAGVTGLLGPNGAGKTTLMRMLATVLAPTSGRLGLLGLDPSDAEQRTELRRRLGYMPQEPGFHRQFTAFEFVDYIAILKEMTDTRARHREVRRVLEAVGLGDVAGRRIRKLSGGMRRRIALAQALLGDPQLLVLDEPSAALDPEQRLRFRELVSDLGDERVVLVSTHQTEDVAALCQRVIVLSDGNDAFDGTPAQLSALARDRVWIADDRDPFAQLWWRTAEGRHRHVGDPPPGAQLVEPDDRGRLPAARRPDGRDRGGGRVSSDVDRARAAAPPCRNRRARAADGAVRWALVRVEARRLLKHPLFLAGMAGSIVLLATTNDVGRISTLAGYCFTFVGAAIWTCLVAGLAAGRRRRDGAEDFYAGQPVAPRVRTEAALLSLGAAGLAGVALIVAAALVQAA